MEQRENPGRGFDAVLGLLGLTQEEERAAREFFDGQAGEEVLAGFAFLDLGEVSHPAVPGLFLDLKKKKKFAQLKRLFLLLFARGQATCYRMLPSALYGACEELDGVDGVARAAVYGALIGMNLRRPNIYAVENLLEFADNDPETLKRALSCERNKAVNGKLVLLAVYFWAKYGGAGVAEAADGRTLLELYEEYAVMCFTALCFQNPASPDYSLMRVLPEENPQTVQAVFHALTEEGGMRAMRQKLSGAGCGSSWALFRLTVGMAYLNYRLSERLKNIVVLCAAMNPQETLDFMQDVSFGTPLAVSEAGDAYDLVFGIDGEILIRWAYEKKFPKVLKRQIAVNTERYLAVMKTMKLADANQMLALIREQDPALHAQILADRAQGNGEDGERDLVIAELVAKSMDAELAGKYLRGDCGADLLYPVNWLDGQKHYYAGGNERDLVDSYLANCEDVVFLRRCRVYMLVCHGGYFFRRDVVRLKDCREKADAQGVMEIFGDFEAEGVPDQWQVSGVGLIYDTLLYDAARDSFLAEAADVFWRYLAQDARREELVRAFAQADVLGRFFGLLVLRRDAVRNKNEILAYAQDGAKLVRQELLEILCGERGFEAEVLGLLSAKRAAQRELAVRVLACWQEAGRECSCGADRQQGAGMGADYRGVLWEALKKEKNTKVKDLLREALTVCGGREDGSQSVGVLGISENPQSAGVLESSESSQNAEVLGNLQNLPGLVNSPILQISREDLVKELHGGGRARGLAWAYQMPFPQVHTRDGEVAGEKYLQAVLLCYSGQKERAPSIQRGEAGGNIMIPALGVDSVATAPSVQKNEAGGNSSALVLESGYGLSRKAEFLAENLDAREFAVYVNELFDRWVAAGAEAKRRFVLYVAAIHGGILMVEKLEKRIREWSQHGRSAIACEAVRALRLSPLPQAFMALDGMARKLKSRQVREAARRALQFAAAQRNLTQEELADCIVPNFGFDENAQRYFDYGARGFCVVLTAELELEVFKVLPGGREEGVCGAAQETLPERIAPKQNRGKKLKTLPAPGKKDDGKKAAAAYEEFKQIKKQLKTVVASQKHRMEQALATAREWDVDAWRQNFVKNPVMRPFAMGLVFGVYEGNRLVQGFRYMEDGSLETEEGNEFAFPVNGEHAIFYTAPADIKIRLVHPLELPPEKLSAWKELFSDYEITQPVEQLDRTVYTVTKEEADQQETLRFDGCGAPGVVLNSRLLEFGWQQALAEEAGKFFEYYRVDGAAGLAAKLEFSGNYNKPENEEVVLYGVRFYRAEDARQEIDLHSMADGVKACRLCDVPARYFSEVLWQIAQAIA